MATATPKAPSHIRDLLNEVLTRMDRGMSDPIDVGHSEDFKKGEQEGRRAAMAWIDTWMKNELAQALSYLDGVHSVRDIQIYGQGTNYRRIALGEHTVQKEALASFAARCEEVGYQTQTLSTAPGNLYRVLVSKKS